jgi:rRNA maturation protein Nop10
MKLCTLCGGEVEIDKYFTRTSECPHCGGDLHICLNCRFHSETAHNKCLEPKAEFQRVRDRANYCDYFECRESAGEGGGGTGTRARDDARRAFDNLFKKP